MFIERRLQEEHKIAMRKCRSFIVHAEILHEISLKKLPGTGTEQM
jgi:hypothetical protein